MYLFWSFIHLQFYEFPWYYPTRGILWFFYALIIGNVIVFLATRVVKNKTLLIIWSIVLIIFMGLADGWYGYSTKIPILGKLIIGYYDIFETLLSGFTYGVLFSLISYLLVHFYEGQSDKLQIKKHVCIILIFLILYSVEGYYAYINGLPREYAFWFIMTPLCISIFTLILKIDIQIPYSNCLGKMSTLMYFIHIIIGWDATRVYLRIKQNLLEIYMDLFMYMFLQHG